MLSERECREMKAMAQSADVRDEFRQLKAAQTAQPVDLNQFLRFLTAMSRFSAQPTAPRPFVPYARVLL